MYNIIIKTLIAAQASPESAEPEIVVTARDFFVAGAYPVILRTNTPPITQFRSLSTAQERGVGWVT